VKGRIPQNFIDDLIARADIVDVVNARVPLKKKGREYSACCPFHNEKTPSFTVSQNKQFYHCFGCGAHGTALGFLMEYENLDFVDAVEALAAEYNLDVPRENVPEHIHKQKDDRQAIYDALAECAKLYQQELKNTPRAVDYLKQRGLTGDIAKTYQLGYAPDGWGFISDKLAGNTSTRKALLDSGVLIEKSADNVYDRFRDRIMFPIIDKRGRVIGFGGRILDQGEPKYLNSPESIVFHKGLELYGLYEARKTVRDLQRIIIVEGYMDVVALAQHGICYAVASLGTATTREQIQTSFRSVREIIFCYDGDNAGIKAAWRALENALPILRDGMIARFLFLPGGEDPDTMVRKEGREKFEQRLDSAMPLSDFLFQHLEQEADTSTQEGKARLAELAKSLLAKMPDSVFRDLLFEQLAKRVGITAGKLSAASSEPVSQPAKKIQTLNRSRQTSLSGTRDAVALLLQYPDLAEHAPIPDDFADSPLQGLDLLHALYHTLKTSPGLSSSALLERWREKTEFPILEKLLQHDVQGTENSEARIEVYQEVVQHLVKKYQDYRFELLHEKMASGESLSADELTEYRRHTGAH
jgi:DNA primase